MNPNNRNQSLQDFDDNFDQLHGDDNLMDEDIMNDDDDLNELGNGLMTNEDNLMDDDDMDFNEPAMQQ